MFMTSIGHYAQELTDFRIKKIGMIGFEYRAEGRRCMVGLGVVSRQSSWRSLKSGTAGKTLYSGWQAFRC